MQSNAALRLAVSRLRLDLERSEAARKDLIELLKKRQASDFLFPERKNDQLLARIADLEHKLEDAGAKNRTLELSGAEAIRRSEEAQEKLEQTHATLKKTVDALRKAQDDVQRLRGEAITASAEHERTLKDLVQEREALQAMTMVQADLAADLQKAQDSRLRIERDRDAQLERVAMLEKNREQLSALV